MANNPSKVAAHRVLIVDDHPLYRDGLRRFINSQPDLVCCGEADSCLSGFEEARRASPDLVILDLRLHDGDGLELLKNLLVWKLDLRVLALSQKDEAAFAEPTLRAGALGYIMKEEATQELLTAIRMVLKRQVYVSRRLSAVILKRFLSGARSEGIPGKLSDRELQVFQFIGSGMSTPQIAEQLHLSAKTVETHRENIKRKLELRDAVALAQAAGSWVQSAER